jgi:2-oxoglutarate ferredoxin oxidoreductase subunit alpha
MMSDAFDLAERLQTPVIVMTDLDLGMNENMSPPLEWDDTRTYDRGKVLDAEGLESAAKWGRYLDVDGDGICYRTLPGTHPEKGAYFTRGTSRDEYAKYTEEGDVYVRNMQRLQRKWETTKTVVPKPELFQSTNKSKKGLLFFGTSAHSTREALDILAEKGEVYDALRLRSFPFSPEVEAFVAEHDVVYVIEQNRDAQLRTLMMAEMGASPDKLKSILNYDGAPITAATICEQII